MHHMFASRVYYQFKYKIDLPKYFRILQRILLINLLQIIKNKLCYFLFLFLEAEAILTFH